MTIEGKREKMINNLPMKKYPKGLDEIECKHVDESMRSEFSDCFPLGNKLVEGVKVHVDKFLPPPGKIVYCPLNNAHKNKIKQRILMFHYISQQCPIFVIFVDSIDPSKFLETRPRNLSILSNSMFFTMGGQQII